MFSPIWAGDEHTVMPAASMARILSGAAPEPPEMIAPAWPMRRPGGAVCPAINPTTGFFTLAADVGRRRLFRVAADFADHHDGVRIGIRIEKLDGIEKRGADDRIAADADAGGLADARASSSCPTAS